MLIWGPNRKSSGESSPLMVEQGARRYEFLLAFHWRKLSWRTLRRSLLATLPGPIDHDIPQGCDGDAGRHLFAKAACCIGHV